MIKTLRYALASALVAATAVASTAGAATVDGVTLPDRYPVAGQTLVLNGIGVRTLTILEVKIYVAALYLAKPSHDAAEIMASPDPKVLVLEYLHSGSKSEVQEEYRKGEQTNCGSGGCAPSDASDFERLVAAAPGVKVGDTTTYIFTQRGVQVYANNQPIGDFANKDLADHLLGGFIGAHPPSQDLRSHLLGLARD